MSTAAESVKRVCLVGTGFIGLGWAVVFSRAGIEVRAYDRDPEQLDKLRSRLAQAFGLLERTGWLQSNAGQRSLDHVTYHNSLPDALDEAEYVQESVPERLDSKRGAFEEIDRLVAPSVVIGSSSSAIPISDIASETRHPERCLVVHPTNPPHIVPLVEIVPGRRTADSASDMVRDLMIRVGQSPVLCRREVPGFILNRLQFALEREAFCLAREGVASVADIDRTVSDGLGLRWALMGPFLVEETNATSIRDDLEKFGVTIQDLFESVCQPLAPLNDRDIERAERGVRELMDGRSHDDLLAFRDVGVMKIRGVKASLQNRAGDDLPRRQTQ